MREQSTHLGGRLVVILCAFGILATVLSAWISAVFAPIGARVVMARDMTAPMEWMETVPESWPARADSIAYVAGSLNTVPYSLRPLMKQSPASVGNPPRSARLRVRQGFASGMSIGPNGLVFQEDDPTLVVDQIRVGWPINTMMSRGPEDGRPESGRGLIDLYQSGIVISGSGTNSVRAIPFRPRWGAFTMSVLGWAMFAWILWLCYRMTGVYRRRRWRTMGHCHECGYAIEDLEVCPECGAQDERSDA